MIVVIDRKTFEKKVTKLVKYADYVGVDGENYGYTSRSASDVPIATKYSHMVPIGSYTPDTRLLSYLRKKKKGQDVSERRIQNETEMFLEDKAFLSGVLKTFKILYSCGYNEHINIFIVLPNIVYKYLKDAIIEAMENIAKMDYKFIFTYKEVKDFGFDKLEKPLGKKRLIPLAERVSKLEKKHKIKYYRDDD